jgi:hypothetical protein
MSDIVAAAGKYGGFAGVILAFAVIVLVAIIKKKESMDPQIFGLVRGFVIFLGALSLVVVGLSFFAQRPQQLQPENPSQPKTPAPSVKTTEKKPTTPTSIRVTGNVVPIPREAARITIVGSPGEWPIDPNGAFDFRVQGITGEQTRIRILERTGDGTKVVYDGYQDLTRPFSVRISD